MFNLEIQDRNNEIYNFLVTKDIYDLAHSDPSYAEKFLIMQKQQYPELFKDKPTTTTEIYDKILKLSNGSNTVKLYVSNNIYERANINPQFAQELFNRYNKEIVKQISHCIETNVSADKIENTSQNIQFDNYHNESEDKENIAITCSITDTLRHHWTIEQTKLLLFLFQQLNGSLNKGKMTHNCFWNEISAGMRKKGYTVTTSQCNTKMENLKKAYKKCCDHNRQTGNAPKKIEHYDILHEIFAKTPWMQPLSTVGSSKSLGHHMDQEPSTSKSLKRGARNNKDDYMKEFLQLKKQKLEIDKEYKENKLAILRDIQKKL